MHKVLIADDEANIRHILDFTLHAEGFEVVDARNGDDAFTLAVSEQPDLIILDVMMPGTNGVETCRLLKADRRTKRIPVLLLTARSTREDRQQGEQAGADGYVTKPFSPRTLMDTVTDLLGARRS